MSPSPRPRRGLLFAPGNRIEVHGKALASGADVVCLDLEDAVPPHAKQMARAEAIGFLGSQPGPERVVRINAVQSAEGLRDLLAIIEARPEGGVVFLPKVGHAQEVRLVDTLLQEAGLGLSIAVLIESIDGVENASEIMRASPRIVFGMFGGADLSSELGVTLSHEPLLYARSRVVHAAHGAGIDVFDVPSLDFRNLDVVKEEAGRARMMGFTGKAVLHPANIPVVNAVFAPSDAEVARATAIIKAYDESPSGLAIHDGKLVEKPVVRAMQRILALSKIMSSHQQSKLES